MDDQAPFGLSAESVSSLVRAKNKALIALGVILIGLTVYYFWF